MKEQYIKLLQDQINKLTAKDFDLESWKDSTILVLERIFGRETGKIRKIEEIHYDLSSWSLRDTLGTSAHLDTCKLKGKEILTVCINEIEILGVPETTVVKETVAEESRIVGALEDELRISQFRELQDLYREKNREIREKQLFDFLGKIGSEASMRILAKILSTLEKL